MDPAERRELILAAASRAFASHPYEEVSLAAIAREAHASEALVHKYFTSKAGIYAQVLQRATDELAERTRQADDALPPNSSARDRVRTSILTYLDFIAERSPGWMAYQILAGHEPGEAAQRHSTMSASSAATSSASSSQARRRGQRRRGRWERGGAAAGASGRGLADEGAVLMAKEGGKGQRRPAKPHQKQEQIQGAEKRGCRNISGDLML